MIELNEFQVLSVTPLARRYLKGTHSRCTRSTAHGDHVMRRHEHPEQSRGSKSAYGAHSAQRDEHPE